MVKLFLAAGPLQSVPVDIQGPSPKTTSGNQHVVYMMDRYSKITHAIPTGKVTSEPLAALFLDNLVIQNANPNFVLADNAPSMSANASRCYASMATKLATTVSHPQKKGEVE